MFERTLCEVAGSLHVSGVKDSEQFMSYSDLNALSNAVARRLRPTILSFKHSIGKTNGDQKCEIECIAVDIDQSILLIVAILAILKLGLAYVPIDGRSALHRNRYILNQTDPVCILSRQKSAFFEKEGNIKRSGYHLIDFDSLMEDITSEYRNQNGEQKLLLHSENLSIEEMLVSLPSLMAIIYTSGSTGRPKGVKILHSMAANRILWQWDVLPFIKADVVCQKASLMFIDSLTEIFGTALKMASMVIAPRELATNIDNFLRFLSTSRITRLTVVASLLNGMLKWLKTSRTLSDDPQYPLDSLRLVISTGEVLPVPVARMFFDVFPTGKTLCNFYGSTETTGDIMYEIFRSVEEVEQKSSGGMLSIGRPIFNSAAYILDESFELVPVGRKGEIYVSGLNISSTSGYVDIGNEYESHIANCFSKVENENHDVLYQTGDYGYIMNDAIIYDGRHDMQVKITGQRVNLEEVRRVLVAFKEIQEVVVLWHQPAEVVSFIVAYYTTSLVTGESAIKTIEDLLLHECEESLPKYMIPKLLHVEHIPLQLHSGKVDRVALRSAFEKSLKIGSSPTGYAHGSIEEKTLAIIAMNLGIPTDCVQLHKSFTELGGNSVALMRTIVQLRKHGLRINIEKFCRVSDVQAIIDCINAGSVTPRYDQEDCLSLSCVESRFVIKPIASLKQGEALNEAWKILSQSFVQKDPLAIIIGLTEKELLWIIKRQYSASNKEMSFIVMEQCSDRMVGVNLLSDFSIDNSDINKTELCNSDPLLVAFHSFLNYLDNAARHCLRTKQITKTLESIMLGVSVDLSAQEQIMIVELMEQHTVKLAETSRYEAILTHNTHQVTQDICQYLLGYEILCEYLLRDQEVNGIKLFENAADDFYIKTMVKYIRPDKQIPSAL